MIGLFGIIANEGVLKRVEREKRFSLMMNSINKEDFNNTFVAVNHFSVGLTSRNIGENKDLSLKLIRNDFLVAFCGYGKLKGEKRLCWAEEMIDKVVPLYQYQGQNILTNIEGSFVCLIVEDSKFFIVSDRFSSKNLFYYQRDKAFVFAPDVGRLIESELVSREKDLDAAKQVLISGFFLDDSTLARGVRRFPYANLLEGVVGPLLQVKSRRYWDVPEREGSIDEITPNLVDELRERLEHTIYELADLEEKAIVPLSGGLDSRAIAYYVSKRQHLDTVTYDLGQEVSLSKRVCKALNGSRFYFSNEMLCSDGFKQRLKKMVEHQRIHAVLNQYFYAPLFKEFFKKECKKKALYDGVYMDILFSAPYTYKSFRAADFIKVYGRGANTIGLLCRNWKSQEALRFLEKIYTAIEEDLPHSDGVGKSQKAYLSGRLRRNVLEFLLLKEDYAYVFKPGFNYDLMDFGYSLSLRLRRGLLYLELFKRFPELANVPFKDSYGIRKKTLTEKLRDQYVNLRLKLSYGTNGRLGYFAYQTEWFFLGEKEINSYKDMFLKPNCIEELFDDNELKALFDKVKKKHYLFNLFQRVLFLQQFYRRYKF